jgi:AbrB family looped-hinge helix DNA binding protein
LSLGVPRFLVNQGFKEKGQVVLPSGIRKQNGLRPGDPLDAGVQGGRMVLRPRKNRSKKASIIRDPVAGFRVLSAGPDAPALPSKPVEEISFVFIRGFFSGGHALAFRAQH